MYKKWSKHSSESRRNGWEVIRGRAGAFILKLIHVQNISNWYSVESIKLMMSIFYLSAELIGEIQHRIYCGLKTSFTVWMCKTSV